ncbi:hypothetical protein BDK89_0119 [Ilumatobacter fluminis]|uniref:Phytase-like protein with esterase activity n=1 Tax=Ilumatobacter fluminis TaxID=467091 RepID=A0A4R7HVP5_9ACTN|nr:hypothetical protein [Ilumatobacter fluminis]TDT14564.1 hypothetical protein BDK89_0119 [Ilumatobacter fluminis]
MGKAARLALVERVDIPVVEVSGAAARTDADGRHHLLAIGDRTAEVATGIVDESGDISWRVVDLADVDAWPDMGDDSQFESIAADGTSIVAVMREEPPVVLVADVAAKRFLCRIRLDDEPALVGMWDEENSRGEGLMFLRGGRLLVAKEKHPAALVEFAPAGAAARGVGPDDILAPDERWEAPTPDDPNGIDVTFHAVAVWPLAGKAAKALGDVSAIGETDDLGLWLLSDQSRSVARLSLDPPLPPEGGKVKHLDRVMRLPKHSPKPEGLARLPDGRFLVCLDIPTTKKNGLILRAPD